MKKIEWMAVLLVCLAFFSKPAFAQQTEVKPFVVGMEVKYAPFNWAETDQTKGGVPVANSQGEYANGYDVWMAQQMAEALGRPLEIQKIEWDGLPPALLSGKIDAIIAGMSPTPERKEIIDFTDNYYTSDLVLVVKKSSPYARATSLSDFSGAKVTGQLNTFHYNVIDQIKGVQKQTAMDAFPTMITAVKSGTIDAYVSERPGALAATVADPDLSMVAFEKGKGFEADPADTTIAIGLPKGSPLVKTLNEALSQISEETRQQAMERMVRLQAGVAGESEQAAGSPVPSNEGFFSTVASMAQEYASLFLRGAGVTLLISLVGTTAGLLIGFMVQVLRTIPTLKLRGIKKAGIRAAQLLATGYVELFRSTPMIVQAMLIYYGSRSLFGLDMNPLVAGMVVVSINTGAYLAETIRGGIDAVDPGQFEAAHALGLTHGQMMRHVILPQAMRAILPSIGNELIVNIKDTSVLNVISVTELFFVTKSVAGSTFQIFEAYLIVLLIYLVLTQMANLLVRTIGKRVNPEASYGIKSVT